MGDEDECGANGDDSSVPTFTGSRNQNNGVPLPADVIALIDSNHEQYESLSTISSTTGNPQQLDSLALSSAPDNLWNAIDNNDNNGSLNHQQASIAKAEAIHLVSSDSFKPSVPFNPETVALLANNESLPPLSEDPCKLRQRDDTSFGFNHLSDPTSFERRVVRYDKYYSKPSQRYVDYLSNKYFQNAIEYLPP